MISFIYRLRYNRNKSNHFMQTMIMIMMMTYSNIDILKSKTIKEPYDRTDGKS